ncbi:MAG TPA: aminotransferase class V-fold PLP-dependent enzyme [Cyclobacteriaceae bacterium]
MKDLFLLDPEVTYLNCANMSPLLKSVKEAAHEGIETRAHPWKLTGKSWFTDSEVLRDYAAKIYQTSADNIAFAPSASYGLATAAKNIKLKAGQEIIILEKQFPSNVYVWEKLAQQFDLKLITVKKEKDKSFTESIIERISDRTGVVAIPNNHWMDGALVDLEKVSKKVKSVNALLILDLSQSLGALPINIEKIDPDYAVSVGYKWMMGPYSMSYQYIAPRWQEAWEPLEYSWMTRSKSDDFTTLTHYTSEFRTGARKFDVGEFSQFNTMPMCIAALKQITDWGIDTIQSHAKKLTNVIREFNATSANDYGETAGHMIAIPFGSRDADKVKKHLAEKKIMVSYRESIIRVSPNVYNSVEDVSKLLNSL